MATALAEAGRLDRAEETARGIPDPGIRATALGAVAKVLASSDRPRAAALLDDAERTARGIGVSYVWPLVLGTVAEAQAAAGFWEWAERTVGDIPPHFAAAGAGALRSVAGALTDAGQWDRAEATARRITGGMVRAAALARVGRALLAVDGDRGLALLEEAEQRAVHGSAVSPDDAEPLTAVVRTLLEVGPDRGPALAAALQRLPGRVVPIGQARATGIVAKVLADNGQWDRAGEAVGAISDPAVQAEARRDLAGALAAAGHWDEAERTAREIVPGRARSEALAVVAGFMGPLDRDRALVLTTDAEQLARQISVGSQDWNWLHLAAARAAVGQWDRAERTAVAIPEPSVQARALRILAGALAGAGHWDRAERTARAITDTGTRAKALAALAGALVRADRDHALAVAGEAEQLAGDDDHNPVETLCLVALVLAGAGEIGRAERVARGIVDLSSGLSYQAEALDAVVEALADARAWDEARRVALSLPHRSDRVRALGTLARVMSRADRPAALTVAAEAERLTRDLDGDADTMDDSDSYAQGQAAQAVAGALGVLGRWDDAERQVRGIADRDDRAEAGLGLVEALRAAGELDRAERVARAMDDARGKVRALTAVLRAVVELDHERADDLAGEAEGLARAIEEPFDQAAAYLELLGRLTTASTVQHAAPDDPLRARAHRLLALLLTGPSWPDALTPLARLDPSALEAVGRALQGEPPGGVVRL